MINMRMAGVVTVCALLVGNVVAARAYMQQRDASRANLIRAEAAEGKLAALNERLERASKVRASGEQYQIEVRDNARSTEWGAGAVPADVAASLCKRTRCAVPAVPASDR